MVGLLGQNGSEGWRQGSPFLLVARVWRRHEQCQGRQTWETTTVSVRWQLLLTLGIACHLARCSRLLDLAPTSPMESRALAFRQGRALSAHYSRCWWPGKGWTDVGRDLGSNKSLDHNNAAPELLLRCLTDVGAPRLRLDGKTTHTVPSFLLL